MAASLVMQVKHGESVTTKAKNTTVAKEIKDDHHHDHHDPLITSQYYCYGSETHIETHDLSTFVSPGG